MNMRLLLPLHFARKSITRQLRPVGLINAIGIVFGWCQCGLLLSFVLSHAPLALALPPLGITPLESLAERTTQLSVIEGTAYVSTPGGVWIVPPMDPQSFTDIEHPTLGTPSDITRVVKAPDGNLYAAANFEIAADHHAAALFRLDMPNAPLVTWDQNPISDPLWNPFGVVGIDKNLRILGNIAGEYPGAAARFELDGQIVPLAIPVGSVGVGIVDVSLDGFALGNGHVPFSIGEDAAVWMPDETVGFLGTGAFAWSLRDRVDGFGINLGFSLSPAQIKLGNAPYKELTTIDGLEVRGDPLVSESDFVVTNGGSFTIDGVLGYYPGLVPIHPDVAIPLEQIFPELAIIDFDFVGDLTSVNGYIYMTVSGDDGLMLFGARDPSVIPEPMSLTLALVGIAVALFCGPKNVLT